MKKMVQGALVAGLALSLGGAGLVSLAPTPVAAQQSVDNTAKIQELIKEKQEVILKKKTSRNSQEQKALGIRIGEIEREIQALKNGQTAGSSTTTPIKPSKPSESDVAAQINGLIQKKQELVNKKKVSRDKQEQKELGKQISQIEKEIKQLKKNK